MAITKITNDLLATPPDDTGLQDDIALIGFKVAANGSLAKYNLVDQTIDDFQNTSGVNAGGSTNETRDSAGKYYKGEGTVTPSVSGNYDDSGVDGDYSWYKWTTVTSSGSYTTDVAQDYEYLVVAGGGGGAGWGGGGAGGYRTATGLAVAATTIGSITVGAGGALGSNTVIGSQGGNSVFSTITSSGGGGGSQGSTADGAAGGSGGGGGYSADGGAGNTPSTAPAQGYAGGGGTHTNTGDGTLAGGGGGGASEVGEDGITTVRGGNGGDGVASSITGSSVTYAGGGGGGGDGRASETAGGSGGSGGGGAGSKGGTATAGTANTGGGGGGSGIDSGYGTAAAGGSGIVIIRRETSTVSEGANLTLVSTTTTAQAAPTKGDIVFTYTNGAGSTTLGVDLTAEYSADGGSTWTSMTLASEGSTGGHNIATAHDVTLTSTSGTSMAYRIKTFNQSVSKTTRIQAVSLGWS